VVFHKRGAISSVLPLPFFFYIHDEQGCAEPGGQCAVVIWQ